MNLLSKIPFPQQRAFCCAYLIEERRGTTTRVGTRSPTPSQSLAPLCSVHSTENNLCCPHFHTRLFDRVVGECLHRCIHVCCFLSRFCSGAGRMSTARASALLPQPRSQSLFRLANTPGLPITEKRHSSTPCYNRFFSPLFTF